MLSCAEAAFLMMDCISPMHMSMGAMAIAALQAPHAALKSSNCRDNQSLSAACLWGLKPQAGGFGVIWEGGGYGTF